MSPKTYKNNIPYCFARRIKTIVSENEQLMIRINVLKEDLISRNRKYPVLLLEGGIQEELQKSREDLRKVEKNKNDKLESREKKKKKKKKKKKTRYEYKGKQSNSIALRIDGETCFDPKKRWSTVSITSSQRSHQI